MSSISRAFSLHKSLGGTINSKTIEAFHNSNAPKVACCPLQHYIVTINIKNTDHHSGATFYIVTLRSH
ncbi:hypothetical protein E2C01_002922 [Portunus trituberculatus]|uniref:Uncharacterized protein n=1 Tax=Portunus trituberculatus TaxID=210409 RepID=A0A5B7CN71_PORTR|nr:hypothetical protein [Portunus trituberculatus]